MTASGCSNDRPVLVTGASKGLGAAIAIVLGAMGFPITVHFGRDSQGADETARRIVNHGGKARVIGFDVSDRAETKNALVHDIEHHGAYWGIVHNAGIVRDNAFPALSDDDWDDVIRTDLDSFHHVIGPAVMPMIQRREGGRIVVMSSASGVMGNRGQVNYSAAKAGLIGASKALAIELAKRQITVNCVAPGVIATEMTKHLPQDEVMAAIPMRRVGTVDEVAGTVAFLFSEHAGYITRQVISVNGGLC